MLTKHQDRALCFAHHVCVCSRNDVVPVATYVTADTAVFHRYHVDYYNNRSPHALGEAWLCARCVQLSFGPTAVFPERQIPHKMTWGINPNGGAKLPPCMSVCVQRRNTHTAPNRDSSMCDLAFEQTPFAMLLIARLTPYRDRTGVVDTFGKVGARVRHCGVQIDATIVITAVVTAVPW